jgi:hypothetical protein
MSRTLNNMVVLKWTYIPRKLLCAVTSGAYPEPRAGAAGSGPHSQDWPEESHRPSQVRGANS